MSNVETALITEKKASGNDNIDQVVKDLIRTYKPNRSGINTREYRIDHTGMVPNDRDIYGYRRINPDDELDLRKEYFLLFKAGWYLSLEENYVKEQMLKDPEVLALNEGIWAAMEKEGIKSVKKAGAPAEVKVIT